MMTPPPAANLLSADGVLATTARSGLVALARFGLVVKGSVQLLVALLLFAALLGVRRGRITDAPGALLSLGRERFGHPVLFLLACGLFAYAGFRIYQGVCDPRRRPLQTTTIFFRIADVVSGIGYILLGVGASRLFFGLRAATSDARSRQLTAEALALPYGPKMLFGFTAVLFALAALFLARALIVRDVCGDLTTEKMSPFTCRTTALLIRFASVVQALLFGTMATLFYRAAVWQNASAVRGMGGVLRLLAARHGTTVVVLIAFGFLAMATTSFIEARWRKELEAAPVRR